MKKVLLVEDDPFLIDIYTTKLKEFGFLVDIATTGQDCLRKLEEEKFGLLILDIVLPQVDGWEILERIKKERENQKIRKDLKIVVLSNLGQKEEVERGLKLGADKYLIKAHYTPSEVMKEIKELL
jgi:DNA-binding response OmpR family regulator